MQSHPVGRSYSTTAQKVDSLSFIGLCVATFILFLPAGMLSGLVFTGLLAATLFIWALNTITSRRPIVWTGSMTLFIAFIIWSVLTALWAPNLVDARQELVQYILRFTLLFLVVNHLSSIYKIDGLMFALALCGWVVLCTGLLALFQGYEFGTRLKVMAENENRYGLLLLITLPGVLWITTRATGWRHRLGMVLSACYLIISLGLVALSGSRGSAISFVVTILLLLSFRPARIWGAIGALILVLSLASFPQILTESRWTDEENMQNLGGRLGLWEATIAVISDYPVGGVGIGNGPRFVLDYAYQQGDILPGREYVSSHSPLLQVWTDVGVIGLTLYILTAISVEVSCLLAYRITRGFERPLDQWQMLYNTLVQSVFIGYMFSWIKSGGGQIEPSLFFLLSLLIVGNNLANQGHSHSMPTTKFRYIKGVSCIRRKYRYSPRSALNQKE